MQSCKQNNRGITLLEVLLSVAIIALLAGLASPIYFSFYLRNELNVTEQTIVESIRRAQVLSQAVDGDTTWGTNISAGEITLFRGASFVARDSGYDEVSLFLNTITASGIDEVVFEKFSGEPQRTGNIILTSSNNETRTITINAKGMLQY